MQELIRDVQAMRERTKTLLLVIFTFCLSIIVPNVAAISGSTSYEDVEISDGFVSSGIIQRVGNVYTLTADLGTLRVTTSNIILDGNGHTITGTNTDIGTALYVSGSNITIRNLIVTKNKLGICVERSSNVTISNNTITEIFVLLPGMQSTGAILLWGGGNHTVTGNYIENNYGGIGIADHSQNNIIERNIIVNNRIGIDFYNSSHNTFHHNNIINNAYPFGPLDSESVNKWDNNEEGNYWSNYYGTDSDNDGIGDAPYIINENNQDNYPLVDPVNVSEFHHPEPEPEPQPEPEPKPESQPEPAPDPQSESESELEEPDKAPITIPEILAVIGVGSAVTLLIYLITRRLKIRI